MALRVRTSGRHSTLRDFGDQPELNFSEAAMGQSNELGPWM